MIYVENVQLFLPTEGTEALLTLAQQALCVGCPAGTGDGTPPAAAPVTVLEAALVVNNPPLSCGLTYADLELGSGDSASIELNQGTPPTYCLGTIEMGVGGDGRWRIIMDQQIWTWAGDPAVSVYGLALIADFGGEKLLAYAPLSAGPASFGSAGDIIKLTAELPIDCIMPPAPEEVPEP